MCFFLSRKNSQKNFPPPVNQKFENGDQQLTSRKVLTSIALYSEPSESRALEKRFMNVLGNAQQFLYSQTYKSLNCLDSLYLSFLSFFFFVFDFRSLRENLDQLPVIQPQPLPECKHLKLSPKNQFKRSVFCCFCFCFVLLCFFSVHTVFLYGSCHADVQIYKQYSCHDHAEFRLCSALDLYSGIHLHPAEETKIAYQEFNFSPSFSRLTEIN